MLNEVAKANGNELIEVVITYILDRGDVGNKEAFFNSIKTGLTPELGENIMTLAELLRAEGREEGLEKGIEKGIEKGREERDLEIVKHMLAENVEPAFIAKITGLSLKTIIQLAEKH